MIWLSLRLQRLQLLTLLGILVVGAGAIVLLRSSMIDDITSLRIADCLTQDPQLCQGSDSVTQFKVAWYTRLNLGQGAILGLPALIGVFIGAPLFARELEQGTHVLAFTQSVSRTRWMLSKLVVALAPALIVLIALQYLVWWWLTAAKNLGPRVNGPFYVLNIGIDHVSPVGYALFAFALCTFLGVVSRRTLVAMTAGLAAFVVVRFALFDLAGRLVPTQHAEVPAGGSLYQSQSGSLPAGGGWIDTAGRQLSGESANALIRPCRLAMSTTSTPEEYAACLRQSGIAKQFADFVPASQAWQVHLVDASIFGGLAILLLVGTGWVLRRQS
ncbi:ABC transporter permease subunit [Umezawaea sp. Da 62-37]|uniref:ABC transporter permease n=1 Tax=Umezawaea sp. Da 62-37 TaxID=3075927 RepID=UPI0028F73579|nr:ABC transporter permease subunit [Umezawaea sp. Da 62-37]WNV86998.1 ABC transporter permease subunit [Umezawaea sp. Da 62-37]